MRDHHLEAMIAEQGLGGTCLVEPFPLGSPLILSELEERRGLARSQVGKLLASASVKVNPDQSQEYAGLAVAGPEYLVVPLRLFPTHALQRINLGQGVQESRLEPLALIAKELAGFDRAAFLEIKTERSADHDPDNHE